MTVGTSIIATLAAALALALPATASSPERQYVAHWRVPYLRFRVAVLHELTVCMIGATPRCVALQRTAAKAGDRLLVRLHKERAPSRLARSAVVLRHGVSALDRALRRSAAHRGGSAFCRAEAGGCRMPAITIVNVIGEINDIAHADLPILA